MSRRFLLASGTLLVSDGVDFGVCWHKGLRKRGGRYPQEELVFGMTTMMMMKHAYEEEVAPT